MNILLKFLAVISALLALAKVAGMVALLMDSTTSQDLLWFLKQSVYAAFFAAIAGWLYFRKAETAEADTES